MCLRLAVHKDLACRKNVNILHTKAFQEDRFCHASFFITGGVSSKALCLMESLACNNDSASFHIS